MFTGLIETIGQLASRERGQGSFRLGIRSALPVVDMVDGESVAVDGVCLTVARRQDDVFWADAVPETLSRTTLGGLGFGDPVNLERALRVGDRIGGHLVQGHVDATVRVRSVGRRGDDYRIRLELPAVIRRYVAAKGSVAVHGVSLTVASLDATSFEVAVIPETLARTTLGGLEPGRAVNVEVDLIARYLESLVGDAPRRKRGGPGVLPTGWTGDR